MAYTIKLGAFAKLENSTARPASSSWAEYSVTLKSGADFTDPVLSIAADFSVIYSCNYAVFLNRYYWITDIRVERTGYCIITLHCDVLATYKTIIGNTNLYILRSSAVYDGRIKDTFYPVLASARYNTQEEDPNTLPLDYSNGYYLVNIAGTQTQNSTLVQLTPANYKALIANLYSQIDGFQLEDVINNVVKRFGGNPQALLNSVMWFPFAFVSATNTDRIYIGSWDSGVNGNVLVNPMKFFGRISWPLIKHPSAATRGAYLNLQPYINYTLFLPGAGAVNLDTTKMLEATHIFVSRLVDGFTGQIKYMVNCGTSSGPTTQDPILANVTGQYGVPIRVQGSDNTGSVIAGALSTAGSVAAAIATGGAALPIIGAVTAGIGTIDSAMSGAAFSSDNGGGIVNIYQQPVRLNTAYYDIANEDNAQHGRPFMTVQQPSQIPGYMMVYDGFVKISGPLPEQQEIKRYLEGGFYYE